MKTLASALWHFRWTTGLKPKLLGLFIAGAILLATFQDFIDASIRQYPMYLSESLLFKCFWLLFFPLILGQWWIIQQFSTFFPAPFALKVITATLAPAALHLILFPVSVNLLSGLFLDHTYAVYSILKYTLREDFLYYLLVYGSLAYYGLIYLKPTTPEPLTNPAKDEADKVKVITVRTGRKNLPIPVADILYISSENPYVSICTSTGKHLHLTSLKSITAMLANQKFVRVHKTMVVNLKKVSSYKSRLNGDYDVILCNGEIIRLSRNYSQAFKKHFQ